jgi:hypothetical protein
LQTSNDLIEVRTRKIIYDATRDVPAIIPSATLAQSQTANVSYMPSKGGRTPMPRRDHC